MPLSSPTTSSRAFASSAARASPAARASRARSRARSRSAPHASRTSERAVIYWDVDNVRPQNGCEAIWAARIAGIGKRYASRVHEVRAYANDATLGRDGFRERLARAGVRVVEASSAKEAADEQLISDMYALARDQANPSSWVVIVVSRDERLARGIQLARDRGVFTVAVGDFLSAVHRPQFTALRERDGDCGMTESYVTALAAVAANGTTHKKSKLAGTAHETLIWDPRRLFAVTKAELAAHDKVFTANEFGVPIAAPGQCVATWTYGAVEPWTDVD